MKTMKYDYFDGGEKNEYGGTVMKFSSPPEFSVVLKRKAANDVSLCLKISHCSIFAV